MNTRVEVSLVGRLMVLSLFAAFAPLVWVATSILGHWLITVIVESAVSAFFALVYVVFYSLLNRFWETWVGLHIQISMVSIVPVLASFAALAWTTGDMWIATPAGMAITWSFYLLPFTQAWRIWLLVVARAKSKQPGG